MHYELSVGQKRHAVEISPSESGSDRNYGRPSPADGSPPVDPGKADPARLRITIDGQAHEVEVVDRGPPVILLVDGRLFEVGVTGEHVSLAGLEARLLPRTAAVHAGTSRVSGPMTLNSPMPGRVVRVLCQAGDTVAAQQPLLVLEAMKMENELVAPAAATVTELCVATGAAIDAGAPLLRLTLS